MYKLKEAESIYCHMDNILGCGDGGWTQILKVDGSKVSLKDFAFLDMSR